MDYYIQNIKCMRAHKPYLLKAIENNETFSDNKLDSVDSIITKDGNKAVVVEYKSKAYRLNSSYRPIEEAKRWADNYKITNINTVINMFGLGNGMFAQALMAKMNDSTYMLIYEPSIEIFEHTLRNYDIRDIISHERIYIFIEGYNSDDFRRVSNSLTSITNLSSQIQCTHPVYDSIFMESAVKFYKSLKDSYTTEVINTNTVIKLGRRNIDNVFSNLAFLKESSSVTELKKMIPDNVPAIIVAAGPSVEESIEDLKRAKGRAVIFAVDSILRFLLNSGVEPDFVLCIDPNKSVRHFTRETPVTTPLITYMESNNAVLNIHKGKKVFCSQNKLVEDIYRQVGKIPPSVQPSGSVALVALSVCIKLGIKDIILVGQDLAYKDNQTHAGRIKRVEYNKDTDVELEGINGEMVRSRYDWKEFVIRYEDIIVQNPKLTIIDAKQYGAKIKGTKVMDFAAAINEYCSKPIGISFANEDIKNTFSDEDIVKVKEYLQSSLLTLNTIKEKIQKAIKECDVLINEYKRPGKKYDNAMKRIKKINEYIEDQKIYSIMDAYVVALATNEMSQIYKFTDAADEDNIKTFNQSKAIYEAAIKAVDYSYPKLEEAISKL